ncbi:carbamoyltransferase HypF [Campylobacter sp. MIT 99-7217]|uniref:carbamoyltransferase HypF n=1 Tax=Campylobacter sp. MIT 99-7217 TaxID=535091 RepID=UPI00115B6DF4|nr:carbamoyltransferase HypF [Campylobacter sp. MIT 99-7217]TQR31917.1 carbamoyltransferase HypF [Campylobacter sp. MIT 99-7217]
MCLFTYKFQISGLVQGVGFRPFIYNLALKLKLCGKVYNDSKGVVIILTCDELSLTHFIEQIYQNLPPLARIESLVYEKIAFKEFKSFYIASSKHSTKTSPMLSDFALCKECEAEFYDPKNPRFHYPFITCTHCGVRFGIIKNLPYDRKNTTMSKFIMCDFCKSEYSDPTNRRFHAQPISCPKCAIKVSLKDNQKNILANDEFAFKEAARLLKEGKILAIKGMGGFHLVCDAFNEKSVKELRVRKNRPKKPFALMCKNLEQALNLAHISEKEQELLQGKLKPIVILKAKKVFSQIAPDIDKIGIMLAYTPFHLLLFEYFQNPIIATSANLSGESIIYQDDILFEKLHQVFDFVLDYDREIYNSSDDSIAQIIGEDTMYLRTSRGLNPAYLPFKSSYSKQALALGSELKNEFVAYYDNKLLISAYIGDLKSVDVRERFTKTLDFFVQNYNLNFSQILSDKHPNFSYVAEFKDYECLKVQHHFAHICATLFEYKIYDEEVLAFVYDGTGYGDDKSIWGGEIFKANMKKYERIAHFKPFKLIGADIKNIQNLALALIFEYELFDEAKHFLEKIDTKTLHNVKKIYTQSSLKTSSLGRIIDAFGAIIFDQQRLDYEAQIGLLMEKHYDFSLDFSYKFECFENKICVKNALKQVLKDRFDKNKACTGFLNALADCIMSYANENLKALNLKEVILCGGVFQNKTLLEILKRKNFKFKVPLAFPPNDSSIALGQMVHFLCKF